MKKKLCIIDDEPLITKYLSVTLSKYYEVKTFSDPITFIEYLNSAKTDYVLCDYKMEGLNGVEVLSEIITNNLIENYQQNFCFMTAYESAELLSSLKNSGCRTIRKSEIANISAGDIFIQ